jgi:hypothetical protein
LSTNDLAFRGCQDELVANTKDAADDLSIMERSQGMAGAARPPRPLRPPQHVVPTSDAFGLDPAPWARLRGCSKLLEAVAVPGTTSFHGDTSHEKCDRWYCAWFDTHGRIDMTFWRMQLHPAEASHSALHAGRSLAAGLIGLDFENDVGDLLRAKKTDLGNQQNYWAFAHEMKEGDFVLIIAHHFPFALVEVKGGYNYMRETAPEIGVWFRHFRRVERVRYYADFVTNAHNWESIAMTDTISPLRESTSKSYTLIEHWRKAP